MKYPSHIFPVCRQAPVPSVGVGPRSVVRLFVTVELKLNFVGCRSDVKDAESINSTKRMQVVT